VRPPRLHAGLTPLADALGVAPLFGDVHNHCAISYGHGSLKEALARAALQLDFVSVTGHAHWPDMPVDDPSVAHIVDFHVKGFAKLKAGWTAHFAELAAADGGGLIVFPGYEIHSCAHGDYTIVLRDLAPAPLVLADDPAALTQALQAAFGDGAFAFPHHIGYRLGARGIDWASFDPALSPFVEMMSMHGCAEDSWTDRPYLHSMGPSDGYGAMRRGLSLGHVFGVVGNTDHHSAFPGSYGHGRMAAYAGERSRGGVWSAMRARRTNALTGDNIHLVAAIGRTMQGGVVAPNANARLDIEAVAGGFIDCIDVIRNGALAHRISPELAPSPIARGMETLLFLELGWGARGSSHRWECELAIDGGAILGVEPRFRGPEVVSPLEGEGGGLPLPRLVVGDVAMTLEVTAAANPNNQTPATQGVALRLRLDPGARVIARFGDERVEISCGRLSEGALSGNLGPIDSPAWRIHALPAPRQWQWRGQAGLGRLADGENLYVRLRQRGGQMAWTSPLFCRGDAPAG
jgi:hypothetical protein